MPAPCPASRYPTLTATRRRGFRGVIASHQERSSHRAGRRGCCRREGAVSVSWLPWRQTSSLARDQAAAGGVPEQACRNAQIGVSWLLLAGGGPALLAWPGMLRTLYGDDERYVQTYWSRFGKETYHVATLRDLRR